MKPIAVGEIQISEVVESEIKPPPAGFLLGYDPERMAAHHHWLKPHFLDDSGVLLLVVRSYVVRTSRHTILVDTCFGNDKERATSPMANMLATDYLAKLKAAGVQPESVDFVMCTHLHLDHVGWNTRIENGRWVPTFPNAKYLFAQKDWDHWDKGRKDLRGQDAIEDSVRPVVDAGQAVFVEGGYAIGDEAVVEPLPGHTPGHSGLHLSSNGKEAIMTGDLMHHAVQIAEPGWATTADIDPEMGTASRRALLDRYSDTDVLVIAAHFPDPVAGHIVSVGDTWELKT